MTATRLATRRVEKVWGRTDLPPAFGPVAPDGDPVGEVWFEDPRGGEPELLVKYLFTSERLSIQVHPDQEAGRALGRKTGKDEAWLVVRAEPEACIAIGLREPLTKDQLRAAAADGRIEDLVDWRTAGPGDSYYSPGGTVHALGPGLTVIEVQQNCDVTYRLYDYGRPRELHLDEAVEVADARPYQALLEPYTLTDGRQILADGPGFVLERWRQSGSGFLDAAPGRPIWLVMIGGGGRLDGQALRPGSAWLVDSSVELVLDGQADLLVAYPGKGIRSFAALALQAPRRTDAQRRRFRGSGRTSLRLTG
jgi:mannose-6-phosphate isomerase